MSARARMQTIMGALLDGTDTHAEATLRELSDASITPEQLAGAVDAVMARALPFPEFPNAVDCCGTGGDGKHTLNISTAAAIIAASCGAQVAKHGNRAVTSQSGSADVLEALGIATDLTPEHTAAILEEVGIAFLFAPTFHPGFKTLAPLRKAIPHRTIFNLLGPLCNPARITRQVIGVFDRARCDLIAETCGLLGREYVIAVHGADGTDEFSISGTSFVTQWRSGIIEHAEVTPQDAGLLPHAASGLRGGDAHHNAAAMCALFNGETSAYADAAILNAGALLVVAERARTLHEGADLARAAIHEGHAAQKLDQLIEASRA